MLRASEEGGIWGQKEWPTRPACPPQSGEHDASRGCLQALFGNRKGAPGAPALRAACVACMVRLSGDAGGREALRRASGIPVLGFMLDAQDAATISGALLTLMGVTLDIGSKVPTVQVAPAPARSPLPR